MATQKQAAAVEGKSDPVEIRAAEIAEQEGRDKPTEDDLKRAYSEMRKMGAKAAKPTP